MTTARTGSPAIAPGQALGYGLQYTRLTAMLLAAEPGSICSLEVLDDVAEQTPNGTTTLVQSKSALTANPVADHAISLWKTLFNWLKVVRQGLVDPTRTVFEIYVSREVSGELITALDKSDSIESASSAMAMACRSLWGEGPGYDGKIALPKNLSQYANPVIEAADEMIPIIVNLRLVCASGSPQSDIEAAIRKDPVSETKILDIADKLCGWVKRQADKQLEQGLPAVISRDDFHREYVSYVRMVDRDLILKSLAKKPSDAEKREHMPDAFVQQLDLIELSFDDKLEAISDFLRACWDRARWSKAGEVHEDSFTELQDNLRRTWQNHSRQVGVEAALKSAVERGILLHARCMNHQAKVQGMEPPSHFIPGCFHLLANELNVGWHPDYRSLLEKAGTDTCRTA